MAASLSTLGDDDADLEAELTEVAALLCDLPEYEDEFERSVDRVAFQLTTCYDGLLTFAFGFQVAGKSYPGSGRFSLNVFPVFPVGIRQSHYSNAIRERRMAMRDISISTNRKPMAG